MVGLTTMRLWASKDDLRAQLLEYRDHLAILVHENYQLQRGLEHTQACLTAANKHIRSTHEFLAVLQGEQIATTEPN